MTTLYNVKQDDRRDEINSCLQTNLDNPIITHLVLFCESMTDNDKAKWPALVSPKVRIVDIDERPTYRQLFQYAYPFSQTFPGTVEKRFIIANSDIVFDESLATVWKTTEWGNNLWCVTRHNVMDNGRLELQGGGMTGSQDAWVFGTIPFGFAGDDITMGVNGCDSYLAQKAHEAGIKLCNPCRSLVIRHHHRSSERNHEHNGVNYWQAPDYRAFVVLPSPPPRD